MNVDIGFLRHTPEEHTQDGLLSNKVLEVNSLHAEHLFSVNGGVKVNWIIT